jgi:hypothetical protein
MGYYSRILKLIIYFILVTNNKKYNLKFIYKIISIVRVLDKRKRRIRSLNGFLKLASEIRELGKVKDITSNLPPLFWHNLKRVLCQNRKEITLNFVFKVDTKSIDFQLSELEQRLEKLEKLNELNGTFN